MFIGLSERIIFFIFYYIMIFILRFLIIVGYFLPYFFYQFLLAQALFRSSEAFTPSEGFTKTQARQTPF